MSDEQEHPNPSKWWRHRRWQAYASLAGVIMMGAAAAFGWVPEHTLPLAQSIVWALISVVAVYSGGACAVDAVAKVRGA